MYFLKKKKKASEKGSQYVAQVGLESILLPQPPEYWDAGVYLHTPSSSTCPSPMTCNPSDRKQVMCYCFIVDYYSSTSFHPFFSGWFWYSDFYCLMSVFSDSFYFMSNLQLDQTLG